MSFPGTKLGVQGAVEGIPLLCYRCKYSSLSVFLHQSAPLFLCLINILPSGSITAERPVLSHVAAGPAADAEGGGGQREVQEKN